MNPLQQQPGSKPSRPGSKTVENIHGGRQKIYIVHQAEGKANVEVYTKNQIYLK